MKVLHSKNGELTHKILIVIPGNIDLRGIQMFFLNTLKYFDYRNIQIDIYFGGRCENYDMCKEFINKDIGIFVGELDFNNRTNRYVYRKDIRKILGNRKYTCIHVNSGMPWFNCIALEEGKRAKIKKRISHSHSAHIENKNFLKRINKIRITYKSNYLATLYLACSENAGIWMFGKKKMKEKGIVIYNGINTISYTFSKIERNQWRKKYNLTNEYVILHIGAFYDVKNQRFLVDMFSKLKRLDKEVKLIMIGSGPNLELIRNQVISEQLGKSVMFIERTDKVAKYMQMADLFVLPSIFEGLGIVNIEAQATGLKCIVSDVVPQIVKVTDLVEFLPLSKGSNYWAEQIYKRMGPYERKDRINQVRESGFDARITAQGLQEVYLR